ncbi:hypothetical protein V7S43_003866 [Phytophthora oleae]|uniref:Uncharacterized protein n=1 Tax=Phytophthora oleae TaxID=2107226 RepID=A0ABD3FYF0_9STRA
MKLVLELLHRRMYLTGTIQTNRPKDIVTKMKARTVNKKKCDVFMEKCSRYQYLNSFGIITGGWATWTSTTS